MRFPIFFRQMGYRLIRFGNAFDRLSIKIIVGASFFLSIIALLMVLIHYATNNQFQTVGFVALTPLAILIGLSGLMYNRTRAIETSSQKLRSLYAAERLMISCYFYLFALILGFLVTVLLQLFSFPGHDLLLVMYAPPLLFCMLAFGELFYATIAVLHRSTPRHFNFVVQITKRLFKDSP